MARGRRLGGRWVTNRHAIRRRGKGAGILVDNTDLTRHVPRGIARCAQMKSRAGEHLQQDAGHNRRAVKRQLSMRLVKGHGLFPPVRGRLRTEGPRAAPGVTNQELPAGPCRFVPSRTPPRPALHRCQAVPSSRRRAVLNQKKTKSCRQGSCATKRRCRVGGEIGGHPGYSARPSLPQLTG